MSKKPEHSKNPTEHQEQCAVIAFCDELSVTYPSLSLIYAIPNGFRSNPEACRWMKAEGLKSGVPDLCLPVARGGFHGLYIEMKRKGGCNPSDAQEEWLRALGKEGYATYCCKGRSAAQGIIIKYIRGEITR